MARKVSLKSEKNQRKMHPNSLANLQPFASGPDPRRNTSGPVPKDVQELNALLDEILDEVAEDAKGNKMQKMRLLLNRLIMSKSPVGQIHILDRRYGKVKEQLDITSGGEKLQPETMTPSEIAERVAALLKAKDADGN